MAGLTHLAVGLAYKRITPRISVWILIFCAYLIDILFMIFMVVGIEKLPLPNEIGSAPWSHSLFMAILWSVLVTLITLRLWHDSRISISLGLLIFSHWIIDFISQPMTFLFPDSSSPLLHPFGGAPSLGLGIWSTQIGVLLGEFGVLIVGLTIYLLVWKQLNNEQKHEKKTRMRLQNLSKNRIELFSQLNQKQTWNNVSATRVIASTIGVLVGLAGIEHGLLEVLQGDVIPESIWIDAIGPKQRFWEYAYETAITIIPNYFWTGILAIVIGLIVTIWAVVFIERKYGARIFFLLSIILWLVGGGFAPIFFTIFGTITATRINKPLTWWKTHFPEKARSFLVKLWPWSVPAFVLIFWAGVEVAIFGYPLLWFFNAELTYSIQWILGFTSLGLMFMSILSTLAYEITEKYVEQHLPSTSQDTGTIVSGVKA